MMQVAKLFMNGRSQAVRLPAEFRFDGDEVFIRRDPLTGDVILSRRDGWTSWDEFLAGRDLSAVPADFLEDRAQPVLEQRTTLDDVVSAERAATQFPKPKVQR
ncbi:MAG: type II toxin-antitoxin system VapB family antitoxin [Lautropia sp.]|nr:type II toxin-antitoxin system VapB family antitoxin [Lautropia sp.]